MNPMDGPDREDYVKKRLEEARKMADDMRRQRFADIDTKSENVSRITIGVSGEPGPLQALDNM